jgi:hypothetical protein
MKAREVTESNWEECVEMYKEKEYELKSALPQKFTRNYELFLNEIKKTLVLRRCAELERQVQERLKNSPSKPSYPFPEYRNLESTWEHLVTEEGVRHYKHFLSKKRKEKIRECDSDPNNTLLVQENDLIGKAQAELLLWADNVNKAW